MAFLVYSVAHSSSNKTQLRAHSLSPQSFRSMMSDLSGNMSALDLTAFDTNSRRDLFGSLTGRNSSQRGFGDANMGSSSRRDLGKFS
jgi:hypothetical protein